MLVVGFLNIERIGRDTEEDKDTNKEINDLDSNVEAKNYVAYILGREQEAQVTI